ncbi:MAG: hypothetical protein AAF221_03250 [Pseudomonadota bacterium]
MTFFAARAAFVMSTLSVLAACNSNPLIVEITDCPAVGFVRYANSLTAFPDGAKATADNVTHRAVMSNLDVDCQDKGEGLRTRVDFTITAEPGPAGTARSLTLPYFVTVVREGDDLQAKSIYTSSIAMTGPDNRGRTRESVEFSIPTNDLADEYVYEVLIGFELTNTQARYNLES